MKTLYIYSLLLTFALPTSAIEARQQNNLSKPDFIGVVYYQAP